MGRIVEVKEAYDPAHVRLLCVVAVLAAPAGLPHLVGEFGRLIVGVGHDDRLSVPTPRLG
jgi:hypothetical protein